MPQYLHRFLRWKYGLSEKQSLDIDANTPVAHLIKAAILMQQVPGYDFDPDAADEKYDGLLPFHTKAEGIDYDMTLIPNTMITNIVRMLLFFMYECVLNEVITRAKKYGTPATHTLWSLLLDEIDLDGAISWDAFEKAYKRHRNYKLQPPQPAKVFKHFLFSDSEMEGLLFEKKS